jgi:hypothetical protein
MKVYFYFVLLLRVVADDLDRSLDIWRTDICVPHAYTNAERSVNISIDELAV